MKKTTALLLAVIFILSAALAGTVAWLISETDPVTNTFTSGKIKITLQEHDWVATPAEGATSHLTDELTMENDDYFFIPGDTLEKDPWVTVKADSEKNYLFVRISEENNYQLFDETAFGYKRVINWSIETGDDPAQEWVPYPIYEEKAVLSGSYKMSSATKMITLNRVPMLRYHFPSIINLTIDGVEYRNLKCSWGSTESEGLLEDGTCCVGNAAVFNSSPSVTDPISFETSDSTLPFCLQFDTVQQFDENGVVVDQRFYLFLVIENDDGSTHDIVITEMVEPEDEHYYYRVVDKSAADQDFSILTNDQVTVSGDFDSELSEIVNGGEKPALSFDAAAVQFDNLQGNAETGKTALDVAFDLVEWD